MPSISIDRNRISRHFKSTVMINSEDTIYAYEARATVSGEPHGRGRGYDLLSDDAASAGGVVTLATPVSSISFDIESTELTHDGEYRIDVYVMNENGAWSDCCQLYTSAKEAVKDSDGNFVLVKRDGSGTDVSYTSAYSGDDINNFITEVLK